MVYMYLKVLDTFKFARMGGGGKFVSLSKKKCGKISLFMSIKM